MAENPRDERLFMRQRGAGDRDIATGDFDFNFGADSREDRQLMRQRGAGARQVESVDFGFHFATPSTVRSRRSRVESKSPGTAIRQHGGSQRTPEQAGGMQPPTSAQSARSQGLRSTHGGTPSGQPPRKRRRLSEISNMTRASSVLRPISDQPNDISELQGPQEQLVQQYEYPPSSPMFFATTNPDAASAVDKENDSSLLSTASKTSTKRRKRKSIGQQAIRGKKKRKSSSLQPLPTPPETQEENTNTAEDEEEVDFQNTDGNRPNRQSRRWSVDSHETGTAIIPNRLSQPASMFVAPNDVHNETEAQTPLTHPSPEEADFISETPVHSIEEDSLGVDQQDDDIEADELSFEVTRTDDKVQDSENNNDFQLDDEDASLSEPDGMEEQPFKGSLQSRSVNVDVSRIENDEEADEDYSPDDRSPEQTPAAKLARRKQSRYKQAAPRRPQTGRRSAAPSGQRQRKRTGIPILTYRITNVGTLPTINEAPQEDDVNSETDDVRVPPAFTVRKSPNAVDVLRQACHEAIDARIDELHDSDMSRADLNSCITALQSFKTALHTQLFQISQSLDHRLNLEARLRRSRKEKAALQARWLEIRQQRDCLDLQKDEIRRKHWESQILDKKRFEASQAAFALENAAAREAEDEQDTDTTAGLELQLRTLAKDVSSHAGGGILQNLKNFNALLESLASASA